jgi:hypothetical protein
MLLWYIALYIIISALVGVWAEKWHRSGTKYAIISLFLTPPVGALILGFLGMNYKAIEKERKEALQRKQMRREKINSTWKETLAQNGFLQYIEVFEKNKVDNANVILALNEQDLASMGIEAVGDRKKILQILRGIK